MANLNLTFAEIYSLVSDFLGTGPTPADDVLTKVKNIVHRAYRQFLFPIHPATGRKHTWSFLKARQVLLTKSGVWKYTLPLNFGEMLGHPKFGQNEPYGELTKTNPDFILAQRSAVDYSAAPSWYAVVPVTHDQELGTFYELWLWPVPDGVYNLSFTYSLYPEKLSSDTDVPLGGPLAGEVLVQMAYAVAELQEEDVLDVHKQEADRLLAQFILADTVGTSDYLGLMSSTPTGIEILRGVKRLNVDSIYV